MENIRKLDELILELGGMRREMKRSLLQRVLQGMRQEPGRLRANITGGHKMRIATG